MKWHPLKLVVLCAVIAGVGLFTLERHARVESAAAPEDPSATVAPERAEAPSTRPAAVQGTRARSTPPWQRTESLEDLVPARPALETADAEPPHVPRERPADLDAALAELEGMVDAGLVEAEVVERLRQSQKMSEQVVALSERIERQMQLGEEADVASLQADIEELARLQRQLQSFLAEQDAPAATGEARP